VYAVSGTSPGYYGAMRALLQLRQVLTVGLGATVIPQQMALPNSTKAFAEDGSLVDQKRQKMFADVVESLAVASRKFAA
jgi:NAD(P)H-dependent FMN reductase